MGLALLVIAASSSSQLLQLSFAAILGGGGLTAVVAWRKAKPEAELSTVQAMKVIIEEVQRERDEAREDRDRAHEQIAHLRRRRRELEALLRDAGIDVPATPARDSTGRRAADSTD